MFATIKRRQKRRGKKFNVEKREHFQYAQLTQFALILSLSLSLSLCAPWFCLLFCLLVLLLFDSVDDSTTFFIMYIYKKHIKVNVSFKKHYTSKKRGKSQMDKNIKHAMQMIYAIQNILHFRLTLCAVSYESGAFQPF